MNNQIRAREVRTIADDGEQLGVLNIREAMRIANEKGLDLVLVAPEANPPVCRIMDYGRHRFESDKRSREARKKQRVIENKELTLSYKIGEHDYQVRLRQVQRFLTAGNKVKLTVRLRGREAQHTNLAIALLQRFSRESMDIGMVEREPKVEGRNLIVLILAPKRSVADAARERAVGSPMPEPGKPVGSQAPEVGRPVAPPSATPAPAAPVAPAAAPAAQATPAPATPPPAAPAAPSGAPPKKR